MSVRLLLFLSCVIASLSELRAHPGHWRKEAKTGSDTAIIAGPRAGEPAATRTAAARVQRDWNVRRTSVRHVNGRSVTIQEVEAPPFVAPARKTVPTPLAPAEASARRDAPVARPAMRVIGVSAVIYGRGEQKRTRLTVSTLNRDFHAWSNIDFRHMDGLVLFRANGREYFIFTTHLEARDARGRIKTIGDAVADGCPRGRSLASGNAAFTAADDRESRSPLAGDILHDLHTLYRKEGEHLAKAFHYRRQQEALRKPTTPPPPPGPVTIRFWKRDMQKERKQRQSQLERGAGQ